MNLRDLRWSHLARLGKLDLLPANDAPIGDVNGLVRCPAADQCLPGMADWLAKRGQEVPNG